MYDFTFSYDGDADSIIRLPLPTETFKTSVSSNNSTVDLVVGGELNILKGLKLRDFEFKILLPKNETLVDNRYTFHEPVYYLTKFREYADNKKPVRFIIIRNQPDGSELFSGNLLVSFESYDVEENAGEEGDFWVTLKLKEYIEITLPVLSVQTTSTGEQTLVETQERTSKETASTYTVQSGDTLWEIAKTQLNDGSRWSEIASINNIDNPKTLQVGTVLKLPS